MPEFTYVVTQRVEYYEPMEFGTPKALVDWIESGDGWDHKRNEVRSDRVEVYDAAGNLVYDTAEPDTTVWTLTVSTPDSRYTNTSVYGSQEDAEAALRENHDPEGECDDKTVEELAEYFNLELDIESHLVRL